MRKIGWITGGQDNRPAPGARHGEVAMLHKFESGWGWGAEFAKAKSGTLRKAIEEQIGRRISFHESRKMSRFSRNRGTDDDLEWFRGCFVDPGRIEEPGGRTL